MEIRESAQVVEVGRPGLEPGTYGLKAAVLNAPHYPAISHCASVSWIVRCKMSKNAARCHAVSGVEEHPTSNYGAVQGGSRACLPWSSWGVEDEDELIWVIAHTRATSATHPGT